MGLNALTLLAGDREDIFTLARAMLTSKRYLFVQ